METKKIFNSKITVFAILAMVLLTTMACSMGGINFNGNKAVIDVTLTQNQINSWLQNPEGDVTVSGEKLLNKITSIELHDGFIRVFGEAEQSDGTSVPGSFDMSVGTENDALKIQIIAVDIPVVTLDDPRIVKANAEMATELARSVNESNGEVLFKEASVTEAGLKLKLEVKLKTNQ